MALFKNGQSADFRIDLRLSADRRLSEIFEQVSIYTRTFVNPISHFQITGYKISLGASFSCPPYLLMTMLFDNLPDFDVMTPLCSKLIIFGSDYAETIRNKPKAESGANDGPAELALTHWRNAYYTINVGDKPKGTKLLDSFKILLDSQSSEQNLQSFLEHHPEFLCPNFVECVSQPNLGGERRPDFAISTRDYGGARWIFVEIERPDKRIFTSSNAFQFTHDFTQAKKQILEWEEMMTRDYAFFARRFPGLYKPQFLLVLGRDHELDERRRGMLRTEFDSSNKDFCTYDDLARRFEKIMQNFVHCFQQPRSAGT